MQTLGDGGSAENDSLGIGRFLDLPVRNTPVWLGDGRLAFLSDASGAPQVWMTAEPVASGSTDAPVQPLTAFTDRIGALLASPAGDRLVFGMDSGGDERQQLWTLTPGGEPRALTADPGTIHALGALSGDGRRLAFASNARARHAFDVWTLDLANSTAAPAMVLATDELLTPVAWTRDGTGLIIERANTNLDHDLMLLDLASGQTRLLTPHEGESSVGTVVASPVEDALYLPTNHEREFSALIRLELATGECTQLAEPEGDVDALAITPAGDALAYTVNDDGFSRVMLRDLASGAEQQVHGLPFGVASGLAWSVDGERLAFSLSGPQHPSAIWVSDRHGVPFRVTSAPESPAGTPFVFPTTVRFPSFDGLLIPAYWYRPSVGAAPWPVVIDVHGGPESQRRPEFAAVTQALLANGIAVLAPNVRGSTGYGKTYCHLDDRERRMDSVADLAAAGDWLRVQHEVDPNRIAVMGQSYGGFMVLAALTTYPESWAAGVDVVGIANFVTFLEQTGPWRRKVREDEYGSLTGHPELLREISPLHRAERITAPLFVIHGRNDPRVPLGEAEQIVARLRALGRDVDLLVFDDEGHGLVKRPNRRTGYGAIGAFLASRLAVSPSG